MIESTLRVQATATRGVVRASAGHRGDGWTEHYPALRVTRFLAQSTPTSTKRMGKGDVQHARWHPHLSPWHILLQLPATCTYWC